MAEHAYLTSRWPFEPQPAGTRRIAQKEQQMREKALTQAPLFADLPKRHLRSIVRVTGVSAHPEGATIVKEGSPGQTFHVILEGQAKVVRRGRTIARMKAGDFFGEISLLDGGPRSASVIAETPMRSLTLASRDFLDILDTQPVVALRVVRDLAQRLRESERPPVG